MSRLPGIRYPGPSSIIVRGRHDQFFVKPRVLYADGHVIQVLRLESILKPSPTAISWAARYSLDVSGRLISG